MAQEQFLAAVRQVVGKAHILASASDTRRYRTGFRSGAGSACAVVLPGSLVEFWRVLQLCVVSDKAVVLQAANTGLTGGSTPATAGYDRDVVIIHTTRLSRAIPILGGRQVICLAGTSLQQLEGVLTPLGREPHSVLGSSCFGASVVGGICNNSGGALVRRGPAYTEMALFARVNRAGRLELVNHLGVRLSGDPEQALAALDRGEVELEAEVPTRRASDASYSARVRDVNSPEPARYNEDPTRLFEASGCAGKLAVFAVRVDTFDTDKDTRLFYIGTNRPEVFTAMRRHILTRFANLPVSAEYIHRTAFDMADRFGKEIFLAIRLLGTRWLPLARSLQDRADAIMERLGWRSRGTGNRILNRIVSRLPDHLPRRIRAFREQFEHHLLLKMADEGIDEARAYLRTALRPGESEVFECNKSEAGSALLHRFVVAGAAQRYLQVQGLRADQVVNLDVALRPDDSGWSAFIPSTIEAKVEAALCYGHFLCHVFHLDYLTQSSAEAVVLKEEMKAWLNARGARYPAEHNVGHLYRAGPELVEFYRRLDPTNQFNPGIGQTSKKRDWR